MAVTSSYNDSNGTITLMHPSLEQLTFNPNNKEELNLFLNGLNLYVLLKAQVQMNYTRLEIED